MNNKKSEISEKKMKDSDMEKATLMQGASLYRVYVRVHNRCARAHGVPVSMILST